MGGFTVKGKGKWCKIISQCEVSAIPKRESSGSASSIVCNSAQWDTGATISLISQRIVEELHLSPVRYTTISGFENKPVKARTYILNLKFPNNVEARFVEVAEAPLILVDLLVGMDIIADGEFLYTIENGISQFSFRMK